GGHEVRERRAREAAQLLAVSVERMAREIEAQALLLVLQALPLVPHRHARELEMRRRIVAAAEEAHLLLEMLAVLRGLDGVAQRREKRRAIGLERVEGAGADERLHGTAVHEAPVHAAAEIGEVAEGTRGFSRGDDG